MNGDYVLIGFVTFWVGFIIGFPAGLIAEQKEAVENGVGEYYLDEDHKRQFRWKKP